jgi:hypothetical protein
MTAKKTDEQMVKEIVERAVKKGWKPEEVRKSSKKQQYKDILFMGDKALRIKYRELNTRTFKLHNYYYCSLPDLLFKPPFMQAVWGDKSWGIARSAISLSMIDEPYLPYLYDNLPKEV